MPDPYLFVARHMLAAWDDGERNSDRLARVGSDALRKFRSVHGIRGGRVSSLLGTSEVIVRWWNLEGVEQRHFNPDTFDRNILIVADVLLD